MSEELPDLHQLWDYSKPAETEAKFRALLPAAEASGDRDYHLQLLTQIGRTLGLQGKFDEAHAVLDDVERRLTDETRVARVRCLLERGRTFRSSGHPGEARPLFEEAWKLGNEYRTDDYAVDAAHMMALVEPPEKQNAWNLKGIEVAERSDEPRARGWVGTLYNNIGWHYHEQGEYEQALDAHRKCWDHHEQRAPGGRMARIGKWSVAKQLRCLGRLDDAVTMQRELARTYEELGEEDGFVFEELGECLLAQGHAEEAKPQFERAYGLLKEIGWVAEDTKRIERLKELAGL